MFSLASPWCLLALLFPAAIRLAKILRRPHPAAVPFSSLATAARAGKSWRVRMRFLPELCLDAAVILMAIALARPQKAVTTTRTDNASEGIAIEMVLDRSASMSQPMAFEYRQTTRLEAVKKIFALFVFGDDSGKTFKGRQGDLVGLVTFAKTAETNCPLTLGHDALTPALENLILLMPDETDRIRNAVREGLDINAFLLPASKSELYAAFSQIYGRDNAQRALQYYIELGENNQTAIGDALALGLARLKQADADKIDYKIKSKVLILLTDGENNHGRDVASVISYAKDAAIKVHVIAIGEARAAIRADNDLPRLARETGGSFTFADSADELLVVYQEIDSMERSKLTDITYTNTTELFQPFLMAALALLVAYAMFKATLFRTFP